MPARVLAVCFAIGLMCLGLSFSTCMYTCLRALRSPGSEGLTGKVGNKCAHELSGSLSFEVRKMVWFRDYGPAHWGSQHFSKKKKSI